MLVGVTLAPVVLGALEIAIVSTMGKVHLPMVMALGMLLTVHVVLIEGPLALGRVQVQGDHLCLRSNQIGLPQVGGRWWDMLAI